MKVTDITTNVQFLKLSVKGDNGKSATITDYNMGKASGHWMLKHPNGQIKYFNEYVDVISYLQKKGY